MTKKELREHLDNDDSPDDTEVFVYHEPEGYYKTIRLQSGEFDGFDETIIVID